MRQSWILAGVGLLAFAVVVWFAGPLLVVGGQAPLASPLLRVAVVLAFSLQYLALKFWALRRARRNNERIVAELTPDADSGGSSEGAQLRERFAGALDALRRTRFGALRPFSFGRSYLYQLPWYMILGAPGTGKTTALLNCGLEFPLAKQLGRDPVAGFGGTRNCDWWFTDRAVLIDTAGRYTTQDSDRVADRQAWELFLQLLLRARPRRPLDGVLVAVSAGDLLEFSPVQRTDHARTLRVRLDELERALQRRLPVYVVITKCDLLPGFMDWFGGMAREERDQVWGVTFDSDTAAGFARSFERLVARLTDGLLPRLHAERDAQRRARIFSLPGALRALGEPLCALVHDAFGPSAAADAPTR
jgi:type VI secretion system protein ImpL